jgi:MerR family transcriptional regulator, copper efflux regulator
LPLHDAAPEDVIIVRVVIPTASSSLRFKEENMKRVSDMTIGLVARRAGCSVPTVRYYEAVGLLPRVARRGGGHRVYSDAELRRLIFIRRCRDFGFAIGQIKEIVALADRGAQDCSAARDLAARRLDDVRRKMRELRALERDLGQIVDDCTGQCAGGPAADCVILAELVTPAGAS